MKAGLKRAIDQHAPAIGRLYRQVRDSRSQQRVIETPHGFKFQGPPMFADPSWEVNERLAIEQGIGAADVFIDIGANCGYYTLMAAAKGTPAVAFEPLPSNLKLLRNNLALNAFSGVEIHPIALAPEKGEMHIHGHGDRASLVAGWGGITDKKPMTVSVDTLDSVLGSRFAGKRLFFKVDVEGFEVEVLRGAKSTIQRAEPTAWVIEILVQSLSKENVRETFALFFESGYTVETVGDERIAIRAVDVEAWLAGTARPPVNNFLMHR